MKHILPRSFTGRALLILIVPIITIQLVVSIAFIQRHYERVTTQMTSAIAREIAFILSRPIPFDQKQDMAHLFHMTLQPTHSPLQGIRHRPWDLVGATIGHTLQDNLPAFSGADLTRSSGNVLADFKTDTGTNTGYVRIIIDRKYMSATNPHQLLVLMLFTSALITLIAYLFLRNQTAPITRLAQAATAFGRGENIPYRPRGATEIRAAGTAFLEMRAKIERAIETRTLMLSGVSHDLRTPLTRLKLGLSMLPEDEDTRALLQDVDDMERLITEFLAFVKGDATEEPQDIDLAELLTHITENARRTGQNITLQTQPHVPVRLRRDAVVRAIENLLGNARRYGGQTRITLALLDRSARITIEDDGPGIPVDQREESLQPFTRLDKARNPNQGGGVGLGLSIAADVARSHGGSLRLGESDDLGGLKVEMILPL